MTTRRVMVTLPLLGSRRIWNEGSGDTTYTWVVAAAPYCHPSLPSRYARYRLPRRFRWVLGHPDKILRPNRSAGIYINLFLLSIYTLTRRREAPGNRVLIAASCVMAIVGTTQVGVNIAETVALARFVQQIVHVQVLNPPKSMTTVMVVESGLLSINKYFYTAFQLYRCFVIWGFQKKILVLPALLMLSTFGQALRKSCGDYIGGNTQNSVCTNCICPGAASVGRILWIRRAALHVGLDSSVRSQYNKAIGIILESGALYCIATIFLAIAVVFQDDIYHIGISVSQEMLNNAGNGPPGASLLKPTVTRFDSHAV
ncbi:hypothetical protein DFH08DRAFT_808781 [Mycena albidolilacea]|uniref:Uncharacterized protein n=1 Tax=Mycena albidolilacea TaxID=1033008 RepID=A0AAD7A249_9AGAR|nr:hypothetical protein DFH08DRAFT_808781 [Mycena albidolilacea]